MLEVPKMGRKKADIKYHQTLAYLALEKGRLKVWFPTTKKCIEYACMGEWAMSIAS